MRLTNCCRILALLAAMLIGPAALAGSWPDLSTPAPATGEGAGDVAVVVGAEKYVFVSHVTGAEDNAVDWYLYFTRTRGIPLGRVKLLKNEAATKETLLETAQWAARTASPEGTVWFVFVGHGAPAEDGTDGVLVGVDAQQTARSLYARSVRQKELLSELGKGKQARTVAVIDACYSGRVEGGAVLVPGLQPLIPIKASAPATAIILSAGTGQQFAGPLPGVARPAFSYLLLGGMRGWADADGDGKVTAQEAVDYASGALTALVQDREQTPELHGSSRSAVLASNAREEGPDLVAMVVGGRTRPVVTATVAVVPEHRPKASAPVPAAPIAVERYTVTPDAVLDSRTNLTWQRDISDKAFFGFNWSNAKRYCQELLLAGQRGWRLPSKDELLTIVDKSVRPPIDAAAFPNAPDKWFWSSSPYPSFMSSAWLVNFGNGSTSYATTGSYNRVLCVR